MLTFFEEWLFHSIGEYELKEKTIFQGKDGAKERMRLGEKILPQGGDGFPDKKMVFWVEDGAKERIWPRKKMLPHGENGHMAKMSKDMMGPRKGRSLGRKLV
jgi:hypothetical protein